jgi:hypothetical protein
MSSGTRSGLVIIAVAVPIVVVIEVNCLLASDASSTESADSEADCAERAADSAKASDFRIDTSIEPREKSAGAIEAAILASEV